jgi:NAD(P)-dependent dehydrogenase (short-subunit alcohol dehydrogenase family)
MRILIASGDSTIGGALAKHWKASGHDVVCTTRGTNVDDPTYLDVRERRWQHTGEKFDRVVFTISHDAPVRALDLFEVNVVGAFDWLDLASREAVNTGAQMIVLTSQFGSIGELSNNQAPWYRMSKAALNMGVALLSRRYAKLRWLCVHPGLVATPMTQGLNYTHAKLSPQTSAQMIDILLDKELSFGLYDAPTGRVIPW